ncbi:MAG: sulfatase-like hydrolase/transferase, partial [Halobacteriaceae archaeon]
MTKNIPNIVLLVLDSVRGDRISNQEEFNVSTPNLTELSKKGRFFENAYSTGSWTVPAHGSLFTGKLPSEHGAHAKHKYFNVEKENTLPGILSSLSYTTVGFSTNPWISDEFGFARGFDEFYELRSPLPFSDEQADPRNEMESPSFSQVIRWILSGNPFKRGINGAYAKIFQDIPYAPASSMNDKIIDWISNHSEEPFFLFANYMDAHEPYTIR